MTVGELQEKLRQYAPGTEVVVSCVECGEMEIESVFFEKRGNHETEGESPLVVIAGE
jgi:hypothetical protein